MTSGSNRPEDGLGERLRELDAADAPQSGEQMDRMFTAMKARASSMRAKAIMLGSQRSNILL